MPILFSSYLAIIIIEYLGLGYRIPIIQTLHLPLLIVFAMFFYSIAKFGVQDALSSKLAKLLVAFVLLNLFSIFHAYIRTYSFDMFKSHFGYFMLFFIGYYLIDSPKRLDIFAKVIILIFLYLVVINFNMLGGERLGRFDAGYFLGNGNDFAWGLLIALPFTIHVYISSKSYMSKMISIGSFFVLLTGILGTQSRGAFLALLACVFYYFIWVGKRRVVGIISIIVVAVAIVPFLPDQYLGRMETIQSYEEDNSAMTRIRAWTAATEMAIDNPILGVGGGNFSSVFGRFYLPEDSPTGKWYAAHSLYFLVLGEFGFPGLFIFIFIIWSNYKINNSTREILENSQDNFNLLHWPKIINMSLIGFAIGGIFLGGLNYPHIYIISSITLALNRMASEKNSDYK